MTVDNISRMPPFDPKSGNLNVIIETPRGSGNKFKYDEEHGLFMFDKAFPAGQSFPFDFGFLPSTKGEDGDPLDALVLIEQPTFVGCFVLAKLLGVIEAEQTQEGKTNRNDRFITVPIQSKLKKPPTHSIDHLDAVTSREIADFFVAYNKLQGKEFKPLNFGGPDRAMELIRAGMTKK